MLSPGGTERILLSSPTLKGCWADLDISSSYIGTVFAPIFIWVSPPQMRRERGICIMCCEVSEKKFLRWISNCWEHFFISVTTGSFSFYSYSWGSFPGWPFSCNWSSVIGCTYNILAWSFYTHVLYTCRYSVLPTYVCINTYMHTPTHTHWCLLAL